MKKLITPPLQKEFRKYGDTFTQVGYNPDTEMYLYHRELSCGVVYYEVFRAQFEKEFGYEIYPFTCTFGFGCALCIREDEYDKAEWYLNNGFEKGRYKNRPETARIPKRVFNKATFSPPAVSIYHQEEIRA